MTDPSRAFSPDTIATAAIELMTSSPVGSTEQWIHLMPSATFGGRDGRGPYRLADAAAVIETSRRYAGPVQIPVDYDHQIDRAEKNGQPAPAAGWIDTLQSRASGIWGRVTWTGRAADYLGKREYRYLSPVFVHSPDGTVRAIVRAALTNNPNLQQLTALASAETPPMDPNAIPSSPDALLTEIRKILGLPDTADDAEILAKLRDLTTSQQAATPDPTQFVPIGVFEQTVAEVHRLNQGVSAQAAASHVELQIRNGNLPPALKDWGVSLCSVNKIAFDAFIDRTRGAFNAIVSPQTAARKDQPAAHSSRLSDDERSICRRMGITEDELVKARAFSEPART